MARLNRKETEKRESIKDLKIFIRNASFYTIFESEVDGVKPYQSSYAFCSACRTRKLGNDRAETLTDSSTQNILDDLMEYATENQKKMLSKLSKIDEEIYCRVLHNLMGSKDGYDWNQGIGYSVHNFVDYGELKNIIGEESADNFFGEYVDTDFASINPKNSHHLTKKEKALISKTDLEYMTVVKRHTIYPMLEEYVDKHRITYTELDYTKPLNELIAFVTKIKNDFDSDRGSIKTLDDLCEESGAYGEIYTCESETCDIFKSNHVKPLSGRLADVLFIYDCRKAGLDNSYILDEINTYWTEIKNIYKDKIQIGTLRDYHNLGMEYIDNEKYKCYLSGYVKKEQK